VTEHLRTQRRSIHIVPLLLKLKKICSLPPSVCNASKIAQFNKRMEFDKRRRYGMFGVRGVQCLMMGEIKIIGISSLKSSIVISLSLE
jgi:hypothetical protein